MALTRAKALGWRLGRQSLDPATAGSVVEVVERLGAVPAWPDLACEWGIGARRTTGRRGDAERALVAGEVVKVFAFGGGMHLMTPQDAGSVLALRASSRMWELPSWQQFYGLAPSDWPRFRAYVRDALAGTTLTRPELAAALGRSSRWRHLRPIIGDGNVTLIKPLTWQGDIGLGPTRDGEETFLRLEDVPGWAGLPELDAAGPTAIAAYLRTYGPASPERVVEWFADRLGAKRRVVEDALAQVDDRLASVTIDGEPMLVLAEDVDDLRAATASSAVRLLPSRDPWVMAPGTKDPQVVPPARRDLLSQNHHPAVDRGRVAGTWKLRADRVGVRWFPESGHLPRATLGQEIDRLATFLGRPLALTVVSG